MGESMVEAQHMDNKMGESNGSLGVSVSFGKYESDALSWEKWSTFSPNKYLEEVGKCSTPGSVAQKKAFFEAHYKKIAAMKAEAELLDQQNATQTDDASRSDNHTEHSSVEIIKEVHEDCAEIKVCHDEELVKAEISMVDESANSRDRKLGNDHNDQSQCAAEATTTSVNDESFRDEFCIALEPQQHLLPSESSTIALNSTNADKLEEAVLVNDESMKLVKKHFQIDLETKESKQEIPKPKSPNVARKVNPTKMEKNLVGMKKKQASIIPKSPETSFARLTKPKATPTPMPTAARSSSKKTISSSASKKTISSSAYKKKIESTSSSLKSMTPYLSQSVRVAPTSSHLSMSMTSVNSDTGSSVTSSRRRSLFMEQMGDKDIVKRAFKTFQNRVNQLPSPDSGPKQLPTKGLEKKDSTSTAFQKENERSRKAADKITPVRGQLGPTWKSVSSGSLKGVGVDERRLNATPTSVILRSNERAERRKEFFKNLEEKSNAREAERTQLSSKSKEAKDAEMKRLRQNLTFKAKPMPSFYRAQGLSKRTSEKEAIKNGTPRRPDSHR